MMGTKNNPGKYDCYTKADPDEPLFVLRAKDPSAPSLVRLWASRQEMTEENSDKLREALDCADAMERWRWQKEGVES